MDRITRLRIKNVRAIESAEVELGHPLTALIGENGAGKSTVLECLELLRKAAEPTFMGQLHAVHRGMPGLLRVGAPGMELGIDISDDEGNEPPLRYSIGLVPQGAGTVVHSERLAVGPVGTAARPLMALQRSLVRAEMFDQSRGKLVDVPAQVARPDQLVIGSFGSLPPQRAIERLLAVLRAIEVHLPWDTMPMWAVRTYQFSQTARTSTFLQPADRLSLLGFNLPNAWNELKNRDSESWDHTMGLVRLGIGDWVDNVVLLTDAGGGNVSLAVTVRNPSGGDIPWNGTRSGTIAAANLSDGQLAWLGFVALTQLNPSRSLLALDEPESHLHPSLLGRLFSLLANLPGGAPVIVSTHSDRVLELLGDPADALRVCCLETGRATISRMDREELARWLDEFGDVGQIRASGYLHRVVAPPAEPETESGEGES
ncbi:MAG: ATPase [Myxococcales bacterium]